MDTDLEKFYQATSSFTPDVLEAIAEIQQPRSDFQLEHFVVGQHDTEEMQYYQCLIELQSLYYTIRMVSLELKKAEVEIARLRATGDEIDELDAQIKEIGLEQTRVVAVGSFRELDKLLKIYNSFPKKFSRSEIEQAQPDYWKKRLTRQATLESVGGTQAVASNLDSLRQIGLLSINYEGEEQKELT